MRPVPGAAALPRPGRDGGGQRPGQVAVPVRAGPAVIAAGGQHNGTPRGGQPVTKRPVLAVDLIRGAPPGEHPGVPGPGQHGQRQRRFGREPDLVGVHPAESVRINTLRPARIPGRCPGSWASASRITVT